MEPASPAPDDPWQLLQEDPRLPRPPTLRRPGNVGARDDLSLDIGWERFEQLLARLAAQVLGLAEIRFRRYGHLGQAQHGIDLAGRRADREYTVVQCKNVAAFYPKDLTETVKKFATGRRPFHARHFVVALSLSSRDTALQETLSTLQASYSDLDIDLWGSEEINDALRSRADIVSQFWTFETAANWCTGAPPPGVAAPHPQWTDMADKIMLSPLGVEGMDQQLAEADQRRLQDPLAAADLYGRIADVLLADNFGGHANVLRRRQLDALEEAKEYNAASELSASLAAVALYEGDLSQALQLHRRLTRFRGRTSEANTELDSTPEAPAASHITLIGAAISAVQSTACNTDSLVQALREAQHQPNAPHYLALLVLLLAHLTAADAAVSPTSDKAAATTSPSVVQPRRSMTAHLAAIDSLIGWAIRSDATFTHSPPKTDVLLHLRLARAHYDEHEASILLASARQLRLSRPQSALVLASQARRDAYDGAVDAALEHWRQAIATAIQGGNTEDASGWLYSIRGLHVRYGPWTDLMDEEHLLAQALPRGGERLFRRVRDFGSDARQAALSENPIEAIQAARRWLADSIALGDWIDEWAAAELLGDMYAAYSEPERAAGAYVHAGETGKLETLAKAAGDRLLLEPAVGARPWWQETASLSCIATQQDLLSNELASSLLPSLIDLVVRTRAGELRDSPTRALGVQATRTACALAGRGTSEDAIELLDILATDLSRQENQYYLHDDQHVQACLDVADSHAKLRVLAVERILDLADVGTSAALEALTSELVLQTTRARGPGKSSPQSANRDKSADTPPAWLRERLEGLASKGRAQAIHALAELGSLDMILPAALEARARILARREPDGRTFTPFSGLVNDSYLASFLSVAEQKACLYKVLTIAADRRELASNRQEALTAAANLVISQAAEVKEDVHQKSRAYAQGVFDGSALDDEMTKPHPLNIVRLNFGPATLRAQGLQLAFNSAATPAQSAWVRDAAIELLSLSDEQSVAAGAVTLSRLPDVIQGALDPALLATHHLPVVRQLAAVIGVEAPGRYKTTILALTRDRDKSVRILLAKKLSSSLGQYNNTVDDDVAGTALTHLKRDQRHSVRSACLQSVVSG